MMTVQELFDLLKAVLITPEVIIITIVIALYVNIVNYVVRYRKKAYQPKAPRVKKEKPAPAAKKEDEDEEDEE